jgi:hypothetical protein
MGEHDFGHVAISGVGFFGADYSQRIVASIDR